VEARSGARGAGAAAAGALRHRSASALVALVLPAAVWLNLFGGMLSDNDGGLASTEEQELAQLRRENRRLHEGVLKRPRGPAAVSHVHIGRPVRPSP
jgi:hypothetical protein